VFRKNGVSTLFNSNDFNDEKFKSIDYENDKLVLKTNSTANNKNIILKNTNIIIQSISLYCNYKYKHGTQDGVENFQNIDYYDELNLNYDYYFAFNLFDSNYQTQYDKVYFKGPEPNKCFFNGLEFTDEGINLYLIIKHKEGYQPANKEKIKDVYYSKYLLKIPTKYNKNCSLIKHIMVKHVNIDKNNNKKDYFEIKTYNNKIYKKLLFENNILKISKNYINGLKQREKERFVAGDFYKYVIGIDIDDNGNETFLYKQFLLNNLSSKSKSFINNIGDYDNFLYYIDVYKTNNIFEFDNIDLYLFNKVTYYNLNLIDIATIDAKNLELYNTEYFTNCLYNDTFNTYEFEIEYLYCENLDSNNDAYNNENFNIQMKDVFYLYDDISNLVINKLEELKYNIYLKVKTIKKNNIDIDLPDKYLFVNINYIQLNKDFDDSEYFKSYKQDDNNIKIIYNNKDIIVNQNGNNINKNILDTLNNVYNEEKRNQKNIYIYDIIKSAPLYNIRTIVLDKSNSIVHYKTTYNNINIEFSLYYINTSKEIKINGHVFSCLNGQTITCTSDNNFNYCNDVIYDSVNNNFKNSIDHNVVNISDVTFSSTTSSTNDMYLIKITDSYYVYVLYNQLFFLNDTDKIFNITANNNLESTCLDINYVNDNINYDITKCNLYYKDNYYSNLYERKIKEYYFNYDSVDNYSIKLSYNNNYLTIQKSNVKILIYDYKISYYITDNLLLTFYYDNDKNLIDISLCNNNDIKHIKIIKYCNNSENCIVSKCNCDECNCESINCNCVENNCNCSIKTSINEEGIYYLCNPKTQTCDSLACLNVETVLFWKDINNFSITKNNTKELYQIQKEENNIYNIISYNTYNNFTAFVNKIVLYDFNNFEYIDINKTDITKYGLSKNTKLKTYISHYAYCDEYYKDKYGNYKPQILNYYDIYKLNIDLHDMFYILISTKIKNFISYFNEILINLKKQLIYEQNDNKIKNIINDICLINKKISEYKLNSNKFKKYLNYNINDVTYNSVLSSFEYYLIDNVYYNKYDNLHHFLYLTNTQISDINLNKKNNSIIINHYKNNKSTCNIENAIISCYYKI
jgi:hypothetical protein